MFQIQDWAGNVLFDGKTFDTFDDGWAHIYKEIPDSMSDTHEDQSFYDDYYVVEIKE